MLFLRPGLAIGMQMLVAAGFGLAIASDPWRAAADWWLTWFGLVSVINLVLLRALLHGEGRRLRDLYRFSSDDIGTDLRWVAMAFVVAGPAAMVPNLVLSQVLWGSGDAGAQLTFRAVPVIGAAFLVVAFPVVHAMAELPTYFGYVMPRLATMTGWRWGAIVVPALVLSVQHMALPLLVDWRYLVWRGLMFLPFALLIGFVVHRRPTTLPYLVVGHALLDLSLPILVLLESI